MGFDPERQAVSIELDRELTFAHISLSLNARADGAFAAKKKTNVIHPKIQEKSFLKCT